MLDPRRSLTWWGRVFLHNWCAHQLLPFGEVLDVLPSRRARYLADVIFAFHDATVPEGAG